MPFPKLVIGLLLLMESAARNKLLEGDGMAGATGDAVKGELFCTGSGRPVSLSERAIRKARALVGEDVDKAGIKRKQSFGDVPDVEGRLREMDAQFRGGVHSTTMPPLFQTGSGKAVLPGRNSIQKARVILEDVDSAAGAVQPMFRTGMGRVVPVNRTVIDKARAVLEGQTAAQQGVDGMEQFPMFQTGSGRPVMISERSIERSIDAVNEGDVEKSEEAHLDGGHDTPMFKSGLGRSILASDGCRTELCIVEAEEAVKSVNNHNGEAFVEEAAFQAGIQKFVPQSRSSIHKASMLLEQRNFTEKGYKDSGSQLPMFRTGSGKSVLISESSVQKAKAVLEEEVKINRDNHNLLNMDKNIPVFASPLKTSCARTVNISSAGVSRAATLLGLEENTLSTQFFGHVGDKLGTKINFERKNPEQRLGLASGPTENQVHKEPHRPFELSNNKVSDSGEHSIRFSTAGGRSMDISSDALQRARSLLGESDHVVSTNNLVGHSLASACNVEMPNSTGAPKGGPDLPKISRVNGKTEFAIFPHQTMSDRKHTGSFENAVPAIPTANKQPNMFHVPILSDVPEGTNMFHVGSRSISEIPKIPKPSSMCLSETDNPNDTKDKTQRLHMPAGPLVDISNFMGTHSGNIDHAVNEKRRIEGRNSASSFKRPRSSR